MLKSVLQIKLGIVSGGFNMNNGYKNDFSNGRLHHEIYMSDARKVTPEKWKTVIRHPICKL